MENIKLSFDLGRDCEEGGKGSEKNEAVSVCLLNRHLCQHTVGIV